MDYTSRCGLKLILKPVNPFLLDAINRQFKNPEPPTYEAQTVVGTVEKHPHNETTLQTDEDRVAWAAYQRELAQVSEARSTAFTKLFLVRGIEFDYPNTDWEAVQRFVGLDVPADPLERHYHFLLTEVFTDPEEMTDVLALVMGLGQVAPEVVDAAKQSFRRAIRKPPARKPPSETGTVDVQQSIP